MNTPSLWQPLTHDTILTAVENILQEKLSNLLLGRNSYINRVFELEKHASCERLIVKFYRPKRWAKKMILEEHAFLKELSARELPVILPLKIEDKTLFDGPGKIFFSIFPKKGGRALDEFDQADWEEIGRLLSRLHLVGALHQKSARVTWRPSIATAHHLEVLYKTKYLLPDFKPAFQKAVDQFIKKADPFFADQEFILLHGDCHKGNLIHRPGEGIFIVDFDDMCFGPAVQDLWMLLPEGHENCENELNWLLKGYEVFRPFDRKSLKLIPLLRGMRLIHFASWLAVQSQEPDFATHFPQAGSAKYWNEIIRDLQELFQ